MLVPPIALALGSLTSVGQTFAPGSVAPLFNSATSWCVVAFVLAFAARRPWRAATLSTTAFALLLVGYYLTADLRGYPTSASSVRVWVAATVVLGPLLGVAAAWLRAEPRGPRDLRRGFAVAPLGGIAIGEAVRGVLSLADTTPVGYWWVQMALGVAFVAVTLSLRVGTRRARAVGVAATVLMAGLVAVAFYVPTWLQ